MADRAVDRDLHRGVVLYFGTSPSEPAVAELLDLRRLGLMCQPGSNRPRPGWFWAADNGCFSDGWDEPGWRRWLTADHPRAGCLFATVPDVVGDAAATLDRFDQYVAFVREARYPVAFVAQDGQDRLPVPWADLDCLFIGGTTEFKLGEGARALAVEARARKKWVHVGRVNSARRFESWSSLADSADGTILAFGPAANLPRVTGWMAQAERAPQLLLPPCST